MGFRGFKAYLGYRVYRVYTVYRDGLWHQTALEYEPIGVFGASKAPPKLQKPGVLNTNWALGFRV